MWCLILSMDSIVLHIKKFVLQYCLDFGQTILARMDNIVYWKPKSRLKLHAIWEGWFRNFFDAWVEGYRRIYSQAKTKIYLRFIYKVGFLSEAYFTELQTATESTQLLKGCYPQLVLNPPCFKMGITKQCTHLHSPPSTSSHPTPSTLTQLIWVRKFSCSFCLKIGACCISRMLIRNPDLDFWNFDSKIHFWANKGQKTQNCPFCLKICAQWYLGNADSKSGLRVLKFRLQNPFLGQIWVQKFKVVRFVWKLVHVVSQGCWFEIET